MNRLRVLAVGLGHMGMSHALAYHRIEDFELAGLCTRRIAERRDLPAALALVPGFASYQDALAALRPDVVSISSLSDSHAEFAIPALRAGAHVFVEKPLAETVADAERVVAEARRAGRKLVVGYILRHHPSWTRFVELAQGLGKPLVMRMNLNQQSSGDNWAWHRRLLETLSPIVDCGVHYLDIMCQMTGARPVSVHAVGARLAEGLKPGMYNYGHLHVAFDDGSVGWYEAGWGPMMSETAFFVKDVIGPRGSASIVMAEGDAAARSDDIDTHTRTSRIRLHHAALGPDGELARADEWFDMADEPDHDALCEREQRFLLRAIRDDLDLEAHMRDAVESLRIVLAADESVRTGQVVRL